MLFIGNNGLLEPFSQIAQQELAQLLRLDRVDETGAPVVVGLLNVSIGLHQDFDNVEMGHVAGAPHGGGSGVGN